MVSVDRNCQEYLALSPAIHLRQNGGGGGERDKDGVGGGYLVEGVCGMGGWGATPFIRTV